MGEWENPTFTILSGSYVQGYSTCFKVYLSPLEIRYLRLSPSSDEGKVCMWFQVLRQVLVNCFELFWLKEARSYIALLQLGNVGTGTYLA